MNPSAIELALARGVPRDVVAAFDSARHWVLYSTAGELADFYFAKAGLDEALAILPSAKDTYGWMTVNKADRDRVWPALLAALSTGGEVARCFIPRHVLQAGEGADARYIILCFECNKLLIPGGDLIAFADAAGLETMLNDLLAANGITGAAEAEQEHQKIQAQIEEREKTESINRMNKYMDSLRRGREK